MSRKFLGGAKVQAKQGLMQDCPGSCPASQVAQQEETWPDTAEVPGSDLVPDSPMPIDNLLWLILHKRGHSSNPLIHHSLLMSAKVKHKAQSRF